MVSIDEFTPGKYTLDGGDFRPHPLLKGGHRQTLAGLYLPSSWQVEPPIVRHLRLHDGDTVVLHDNRPDAWREGQPVVLLLHGLCGCHASPYMQRMTAKLNRLGMRVWRMDHRGWGAGFSLAESPMHAGRSDDVRQAVDMVRKLTFASPVALVGFSLGANVILKYLAELGSPPPPEILGAVAVSPPMDLVACANRLRHGLPRWYERYFLRRLMAYVRARAETSQAWSERYAAHRGVRSLRDFDHRFTAPLSGFCSAEDYYARCSTIQRLPEIHVPTTIVAAQDDPLVPSFADRPELHARPAHMRILLPRHGGHLGFVGQRSAQCDGRWMDRQVIAAVSAWTECAR